VSTPLCVQYVLALALLLCGCCSAGAGIVASAILTQLFHRLAYVEVCRMMQLLRSELQAAQLAQVAKDFMIFAFECAGRSSIGNIEDSDLEFEDFCATAVQIPGIGHALSFDVSVIFEAERELIQANLARMQADDAANDATKDKDAKRKS
jgi:hypothetical protein